MAFNHRDLDDQPGTALRPRKHQSRIFLTSVTPFETSITCTVEVRHDPARQRPNADTGDLTGETYRRDGLQYRLEYRCIDMKIRRKQASPIRAPAAVPIASRLDKHFDGPPPKVFRDDGYGSYDIVQSSGRTNMPTLSLVEQPRGRPAAYDRPTYRDPRNVYVSEDDFEDVNRSRHSEIHAPVAASAYIDGSSKAERSDWLDEQRHSKKRMKWIIGIIIALLVVAGAVGGAVGGVLASKKSHSAGSTSNSGTTSTSTSGVYDLHSKPVQSLLNNKALHKVFPGMDYTPLNAQYPACLTVPPDQNNITLDIAMLSQLTPAVRLYGTDCNQTEMVLEAINLLDLNATLQVWLGVWLDNNQTSNDRQLAQMYTLLDTYPSDHFAGLIIGNEILFRGDMPITTLAGILAEVRTNLTTLALTLPVATSDLGDDWTAELALSSDIVMANVHPFFAGLTPDVAPGWTWEFWQTHDAQLRTASATGAATWPKSIISEVGWPSEGGNDCGNASGTCPSDTAGAVASIENLNAFMDGFVCQSLANGTTFFWFEAFDEPWKHQFDNGTRRWESKWGLMDEGKNVKDGLVIPDCGGKTISKAY
ncbi:hypothetical protein B0A48_07482 [Cryoendolithus antarcticus]|uniref:glucan endo-1,3-beta-D-glucosidase n=1 Tax=Cryoendolithus antarcticus TaxID=1507870 RepID=A0A1V8T685_9PEZI|nr:hypothetical protein B0A48_07482 [Cryoendolithus antarcticus]